MQTTEAYDLNCIARMMESINGAADIFVASARALAEATGFRWAFISRFRFLADEDPTRHPQAPDEGELLATWMDGESGEKAIYDLHRTPCEIVARTGKPAPTR